MWGTLAAREGCGRALRRFLGTPRTTGKVIPCRTGHLAVSDSRPFCFGWRRVRPAARYIRQYLKSRGLVTGGTSVPLPLCSCPGSRSKVRFRREGQRGEETRYEMYQCETSLGRVSRWSVEDSGGWRSRSMLLPALAVLIVAVMVYFLS